SFCRIKFEKNINMSSSNRAAVSYIADPLLLKCCDSIPIVKYRASMTHSLIHAYGLLEKMVMLPSVSATEEQVRKFHSEDYVTFLKEARSNAEEESEDEFGLGWQKQGDLGDYSLGPSVKSRTFRYLY
ncbi:unnamed protein product, partial [Meganyctiphanes norvegica]